MIVIDMRDRALACTTAHVTRGEGGLIVRHGAMMGSLHGLSSEDALVSERGILLLGEYRARSSAGYAGVVTRWGYPRPPAERHLLIGELRFGPLRHVRPTTAVVVPGRVMVTSIRTHGNSNCEVADGVREYARSWFDLDGKLSMLIEEGQSDRARLWRVTRDPADTAKADIPQDHQFDRWSNIEVVKAAIAATSLAAVKGRLGLDDPMPTDLGHDLRPLATEEVVKMVAGAEEIAALAPWERELLEAATRHE